MRNDQSPKHKSSRRPKSPCREVQPTLMEHKVALVDLDPQTTEDRLEAREELCRVPLLNEEHNTRVDTTTTPVEAELMHATLKKNVDLFAWTTSDMSRVSPDVITHKLSVFKEACSVT